MKLKLKINIYGNDNYEDLEKLPHENLNFKESKYDSLNGSSLLIILAYEEEFRKYDLHELKNRMERRIIVDNVDIISNNIKQYGFKLYKFK